MEKCIRLCVSSSDPDVRYLIKNPCHLLSHVVDFEEIEPRRWHGFLIKYLTSGSEDEKHSLIHFSIGPDFNPYVLKNEQITGFLKEVFAQETY